MLTILTYLVLAATTRAAMSGSDSHEVVVAVSSGTVMDSPVDIRRVAVSNSEIAEAVVASPREILINGKAPGQTNMIVWQQDGTRTSYLLKVLRDSTGLEAIRRQIEREFPNQTIVVDFDNGIPIVHGVAADLNSANRILALTSTLGVPVNLLKIAVPPIEPQILVRIRFADVDRSVSQSLGINLFSTGATNSVGSLSTQQFSPPGLRSGTQNAKSITPAFTLSEALNVFLFRPDLNLGATIQALATKNLLQILAEPNVLTMNERPASFLAGGEFPFPTLQGGGAGLGAVTIQFREFGIRLNFTPYITPRGTIRLNIAPEVSSLDFANALVVQGYTIPALSTRRVSTEVELEDGQSFAIAGLLDNRVTQSFSKIPGLGDIPVLGKLFQSRQVNKNNTELIVLVTPEIVRGIHSGQSIPQLAMPIPFLPANEANTKSDSDQGSVQRPLALPLAVPMEELIDSMHKANPQKVEGMAPSVPSTLLPPTAAVPGRNAPQPSQN
jgi:pilus assembly protein CpaC